LSSLFGEPKVKEKNLDIDPSETSNLNLHLSLMGKKLQIIQIFEGYPQLIKKKTYFYLKI
jgi:hypothetical protein